MSGGHSPLTTAQRLGPGDVLRTGSTAEYRNVEIIDGEPHLVRAELGYEPDGGHEVGLRTWPPARVRSLLSLVHLTDLQLADVQSPVRFEFLNGRFADPRYAEIVPVQRPQEALTPHAVDAMLRTVNAAVAPATGAPVQLAVTTGDAIDNVQWNELQTFLALFDGGRVRPNSGAPGYQGVQALEWPDDIFWKPDGVAATGPDLFRAAFGFPHWPGLLDRALAEFSVPGLDVPWLSCFGNHEALIQGVGVVTPAVRAALTGDVKPASLPPDFDDDRALEFFTLQPEMFFGGQSVPITPDAARRPVTRRDFVGAHFGPSARPAGHGFTERNRLDGTAYYAYDTPTVRLVALDTNCLAGGAAGCVDHEQAQWLAGTLAEVHSTYRGPAGEQIRTGNADRLVIVFSHHGTESLMHRLVGHVGPDGQPMLGGVDVVALLHRFPNVVLWLNGHTHLNAARARPAPAGPGGFWEVTTSSIVDWPCQARLVELTESAGQLSIFCTMIDHHSPLAAESLRSGSDLAALHRELASNVPLLGSASSRAGTPADRNVELRLRPPFPLNRLAG